MRAARSLGHTHDATLPRVLRLGVAGLALALAGDVFAGEATLLETLASMETIDLGVVSGRALQSLGSIAGATVFLLAIDLLARGAAMRGIGSPLHAVTRTLPAREGFPPGPRFSRSTSKRGPPPVS